MVEELARTLAKPSKDDRFWRRIRRGMRSPASVLKQHDGTYVTLQYPTQDEISMSLVTYLGGHVHRVDAAEAAALTAAGYTVVEIDDPGGYQYGYSGGY